MKSGIKLITTEREEQLFRHGRSIQQDVDNNNQYQLSDAASMLCLYDPHTNEAEDCLPDGWNLELWEKMFNKPYRERLIIAGALIAAELDRLSMIGE